MFKRAYARYPFAAALAAVCQLAITAAHCPAINFTGVNLAGAEFESRFPGTYNSDYTYPTSAEFNYFIGKGLNTFCIPFRWERVQPTLNAALNTCGFLDAAGQPVQIEQSSRLRPNE
jgi:endoglucanase